MSTRPTLSTLLAGLALGGLLLAAPASAQRSLFACEDPQGRKTVQDRPCGAGHETRHRYEAPGSTPTPTTQSPERARARAVRAQKNGAYLCSALGEERVSIDQQRIAEGPQRHAYWQAQARRVDEALCRHQCRAC